MLYALCASRSPSSYFTHDSTCFIVMIFFTPNTSTWWILSMCNIHNHIHVKNDSPISISLNSCAFLPPRITIAQLHIFFPEDTTVLIRNPLQLACINHLRFSIAIVWNGGKKSDEMWYAVSIITFGWWTLIWLRPKMSELCKLTWDVCCDRNQKRTFLAIFLNIGPFYPTI